MTATDIECNQNINLEGDYCNTLGIKEQGERYFHRDIHWEEKPTQADTVTLPNGKELTPPELNRLAAVESGGRNYTCQEDTGKVTVGQNTPS